MVHLTKALREILQTQRYVFQRLIDFLSMTDMPFRSSVNSCSF